MTTTTQLTTKQGVLGKLQEIEDELLVREQILAEQEKIVEQEIAKLEAFRVELSELKEHREQLLVEVCTAADMTVCTTVRCHIVQH